jgi:protein-S-isoprenylcysteine O-methyltransferase Ste14
VALLLVMAGATVSIALMIRAGHRNPSRLLLALFTGWVLSPFVLLERFPGYAAYQRRVRKLIPFVY